MRVLTVSAFALVGCGRIGFDALGGDGGSDDAHDAMMASNVDIAAGGPNTCVRIGGDVWCWGRGDQGGLGDGSTMHTGTPRNVPLPQPAISLDTNDSGTCVRFADTRAACWGINDVGQFGMTGQVPTPTIISPLGIAEVAVGQQMACIRRTGGTVACAGGAGLLGDGSMAQRASFADVTGITDAISIVAGDQHTCVLHVDRSVSCWGRGNSGQLGNGGILDSPVPVRGPGGPYTMLAAGDFTTCGITPARLVHCWGAGAAGQIGDGLMTDRSSETLVANLDDVVEIAGAALTSCARRGDGTVWCWGRNTVGEVGNGTMTPSEPLPIASALANTIDLSARTGVHACALRGDRQLLCWGGNQYGECGRGTVGGAPFPTPAPVTGLPPL